MVVGGSSQYWRLDLVIGWYFVVDKDCWCCLLQILIPLNRFLKFLIEFLGLVLPLIDVISFVSNRGVLLVTMDDFIHYQHL